MKIAKKDLSGNDNPMTWRSLVVSEDNRRSASFVCINGHRALLVGHTINKEGEVQPSVVCPYNECNICKKRVSNTEFHTKRTGHDKYKECTFHENITLENWK